MKSSGGGLKCLCGQNLRDGGEPAGYMVPDIFDSEEIEVLDHNKRMVWECSGCGRLAVGYPTLSDAIKWYNPEDETCGNLFKVDLEKEFEKRKTEKIKQIRREREYKRRHKQNFTSKWDNVRK